MEELYVNRRLRVKEECVIHIIRKLPSSNSKIFINKNQELSPEDVVGEGQTPMGFLLIHLAEELKAEPRQAPQYLKRKLGQSIFKGELLAAKDELFGFKQTVLLAPADGLLDSYDDKKGELRMKLLPKMSKVASGVYGIVDKVDRNSAQVTIRTTATLVYGVFGAGQEREGVVRFIGSSDTLVSSRQIPDASSRQILVGGGVVFADALHKMIGLEVAGIISGGINAVEYRSMVGGNWNLFKKQWADVGLSIIITEGFGSVAIGDDIFTVLKRYQGCFAMINGNRARIILPSQSSNSMIYLRKSALPIKEDTDSKNLVTPKSNSALEVESIPETEVVTLTLGSRVRVVGGSLLGMQGEVVAIDSAPTKLDSGIKVILVTLVGKSKKVKVPYLNLEVLS